MQKWQARIAPSLGDGFAGTPNKVWGTKDYTSDKTPTVFMGLYGLPDFYALWRHRGPKAILWCGSDVTHFDNGYWLDEKGTIRLDVKPLAKWISKNCDSYVENIREYEILSSLGIESKIIPSFLGDVKKYNLSYQWSARPKLYTSVSGNDFNLYGWNKIPDIAKANLDVEFHLFGNTVKWETDAPNVFVHGRLPQEEMNAMIKDMQGALRLTEMDGFSEILAKSILWGQWPVSLIHYAHMLSVDDINTLKLRKEANIEGRAHYLAELNKYPWNSKQ